MHFLSEKERIKIVYDKYIKSEKFIKKWSNRNIGNKKINIELEYELLSILNQKQIDRTNKIIPTDTSKKLWQGRTAYTIDTSTVKSAVLPGGGSERISFALPYDTSSSQSYSFRDINGGTKTYGTVNLMYAHPDEGTSSASFAEHITLDTVEVSKSLTITSADGTTKTTDVAKVLSQLETDIVNIGTKMGVSLTSKEIT